MLSLLRLYSPGFWQYRAIWRPYLWIISAYSATNLYACTVSDVPGVPGSRHRRQGNPSKGFVLSSSLTRNGLPGVQVCLFKLYSLKMQVISLASSLYPTPDAAAITSLVSPATVAWQQKLLPPLVQVCPVPDEVFVHVCPALVEAMERVILSIRPRFFGSCMIESESDMNLFSEQKWKLHWVKN